MKVFNALKISGRHNHNLKVTPIIGRYGTSGICVEIDGKKIINCDYSCTYDIENEILKPKLEAHYTPIVLGPKHIGLKELPSSCLNFRYVFSSSQICSQI